MAERRYVLWSKCRSTNAFFPFPWPPRREPKDDPRVEAIAQAARELVEKRERWLNPKDEGGRRKAEKSLIHPSAFIPHPFARTLTNLYNERPTWLDLAHRKLDKAVFAAYGWSEGLGDEEILARLLALNLDRAEG